MSKNLEVKARIPNIQQAEEVARSINARFDTVLQQVDTYFNVSYGRLKLREINNTRAELIYYSRNEAGNQRLSDFIIYPVQNPVELKNVLTLSLGLKIQVVKRRILYMYKTTRIHIDDVKELGAFLEFEVPVENSEQEAQGIMDLLISEFAITGEDFIKESYSDMLLKR